MTSVMLAAQDLRKSYSQGESQIEVLRGVSFEVTKGESVSIVGPSGGGKSTLLALLSGVDQPTSGRVIVDGQDLSKMNQDQLTLFRGQTYGIVFQQFHLIQHLTALENVMLPLEIAARQKTAQKNLSAKQMRERAEGFLQEVSLSHRLHHRPEQLSGGEAQRVAIARALVGEPKILLADEPSGNLDVKTGEQIMDLLFQLTRSHKSTLVLVTHSLELSQRCQRHFVLEKGRLEVSA